MMGSGLISPPNVVPHTHPQTFKIEVNIKDLKSFQLLFFYRLLLRIKTSSPYKAKHDMNKKFGCPAKHVEVLLAQAQAMKLNVIGIR
jgi:diaminopimelate decarboxylase